MRHDVDHRTPRSDEIWETISIKFGMDPDQNIRSSIDVIISVSLDVPQDISQSAKQASRSLMISREPSKMMKRNFGTLHDCNQIDLTSMLCVPN